MKIKKLHDLIEFGIRLKKFGVPKGFVTTIKFDAKVRAKIYEELLSFKEVEVEWINCEGKKNGFYSFKILDMKFFMY